MFCMRSLAQFCAGLILLFSVTLQEVFALDLSRDGEIKECSINEIATWGDGQDKAVPYSSINFLYIPNGSPAWFSDKVVLELIQRAATSWSDCGIPAKVTVGDQAHYLVDNEVVIQWSDVKSQGNIGASDLVQRRLYLSPGVFKTLRDIRPTYDSKYTLQMTLSHEMGHFYGLIAHSKRCVDVLSYYKGNSGELCNIRDRLEFSKVIEYRSALPTACDIQRCRRVNN